MFGGHRPPLQGALVFGLCEFAEEKWQICDEQAVRTDFLRRFANKNLLGGSDEFGGFLKSLDHGFGRTEGAFDLDGPAMSRAEH